MLSDISIKYSDRFEILERFDCFCLLVLIIKLMMSIAKQIRESGTLVWPYDNQNLRACKYYSTINRNEQETFFRIRPDRLRLGATNNLTLLINTFEYAEIKWKYYYTIQKQTFVIFVFHCGHPSRFLVVSTGSSVSLWPSKHSSYCYMTLIAMSFDSGFTLFPML
jgi:hypothetical protein